MDEPEERAVSYDDLMNEVRRAGRAAVAARAAAEACEESVERLESAAPAESTESTDQSSRDVIETLLPVCDALARMAGSARQPQPKLGWFERLRRAEQTAAELRALREAIVILDAQLMSAMELSGVEIDLQVGGPVDPERHRVVETCPRRGEEPAGVVTEIVRPGYRLGDARIRDADVVATR